MSNALQCPMCDAPVPHGHRSHRGLLINTIAHLQSTLITSREMLTLLQKKRWSKAFKDDHAKSLKLQLEIQARIVIDEALLAQMTEIQEECYGNKGPG